MIESLRRGQPSHDFSSSARVLNGADARRVNMRLSEDRGPGFPFVESEIIDITRCPS